MNLTWATAADARALAIAHAAAFTASWDEPAFADLLADGGTFGFLADRDGPQGMILCRVAAGEMEILTLAVAPEARRRGVARALLAAALGTGRQAGAEAAFLEVAVDNAAAAALYAGAGFRRAGLRRGYYDRGAAGAVDALVMRLDLTSPAP